MLPRLAWPIALGIAGALSVSASSAQESFSVNRQCPQTVASGDTQQLSFETALAELSFNGDLQMPLAEQAKIAAALKNRVYEGTPDGVAAETAQRVRLAWQNRGFFKVDVSYDSTVLTSSPVAARIALDVHIDEGQQYRLGQITFKNNRAITNVQKLRSLFPLKDGDIFNVDTVRRGLDNLRRSYGELGHIDFTSVPDTNIDENTRTISLVIDVDEGKPFYISSVNVIGLEDRNVSSALKEFSLVPGHVYNTRLVQQFFKKHASGLSPDAIDSHVHRQPDYVNGTLSVTFDFRPCPTSSTALSD